MARALLTAALAVLAAAARADAQQPVVVLAGGGVPVGGSRTADGYHGLLGVMLLPPVLPLGLRADVGAVTWREPHGRVYVTGSLVLPLRGLGPLMPYAVAGYGVYGAGSAAEQRGVSGGAGATLRVAGLGVFAEVRAHQRTRTLLAVGLTR